MTKKRKPRCLLHHRWWRWWWTIWWWWRRWSLENKRSIRKSMNLIEISLTNGAAPVGVGAIGGRGIC